MKKLPTSIIIIILLTTGCVILSVLGGCRNVTQHEQIIGQTSNAMVARKFVDAFYSFNRDSLASVLSTAGESQSRILHYQKWAECGHYQIVERGDFIEKNDTLLICPVTVKDDLMKALNINFNVTDTFHLSIKNGLIRSVKTSSNDPKEYYQAREWIKKNRPELIESCEADFKPCDCIQGTVKGLAEFIAKNK